MVCAKLFSLRQRFSLFVWTIEGKNFDVSVTYPQYYWKVSITLRGVFRKIFYCPPTIIGNFHGKTSYFAKRKMSLYNKGAFDDGFYKVLRKKIIELSRK